MQRAKNIRIVLVEPSHPGNIGAVARVMKNMGLSHLIMIKPKIFPSAEASAMAAGADDILQSAQICEQLSEALQGCQHAFASTARSRKIESLLVNPKQAAENIKNLSALGDVAVVFGRERNGLTNEEIEQCGHLLSIPTSEFSSLNLASAVQVVCYEIRMALLSKQSTAAKISTELANQDEQNAFFEHLQQALICLDFLHLERSPQIMPKIRRLFQRSDLRKNEIHILRGICSAILKNSKKDNK